MTHPPLSFFFFFFNDTATTEIYTLSLHDALPISSRKRQSDIQSLQCFCVSIIETKRSEEHTSELQSHSDLVCRLLLEKKKKTKTFTDTITDACRAERLRSRLGCY